MAFTGNAYFGVFDGHGGPEVSEFVRRHLTNMLRENSSYKKGEIAKALRETYLEMDRRLADRETVGTGREISKV